MVATLNILYVKPGYSKVDCDKSTILYNIMEDLATVPNAKLLVARITTESLQAR